MSAATQVRVGCLARAGEPHLRDWHAPYFPTVQRARLERTVPVPDGDVASA